MIRVLASPNPNRVNAMNARGGLGIALYHSGTNEVAGLGRSLTDSVLCLPRSPSIRAWDFLSFSLAVYGVDRFLLRKSAADGWTREIALEVDVVDPNPWNEIAARIASTLRFLSGDIWHIRFHANGRRPPQWEPELADRDCACLFSGGLDSLIGAADLLQQGRRPLLVSQASPKEGKIQQYLALQLGLEQTRFEGKAIERHGLDYEPSSRARSILFIGYGVLAATALHDPNAPTQLVIPENGLISINPPLTRRRVGSFSTRTTHPHFINELQAILCAVGLNVRLVNPYGGRTKGEMLMACENQTVSRFGHLTYSCGKGKRLNQHCGRCIPCLIRRASFHRSERIDLTDYWAEDLSQQASSDDVFAARFAVEQLATRNISQWTSEAGPLPTDIDSRAIYTSVVRRGLEELRDFLSGIAWQ